MSGRSCSDLSAEIRGGKRNAGKSRSVRESLNELLARRVVGRANEDIVIRFRGFRAADKSTARGLAGVTVRLFKNDKADLFARL